MKFLEVHHIGPKNRWHLAAVSKRKVKEALDREASGEGDVVEKKTRPKSKRVTARTREKETTENPENGSASVVDGNLTDEGNMTDSESSENTKKTRRRTRKKGANINNESINIISLFETFWQQTIQSFEH